MAVDASDEVLVALPHLRPVLAALDEAVDGDDPLYGTPVESHVLGLARVPLPYLDRADRALRDWVRKLGGPVVPAAHPPPDGDAPRLDSVLWHLRAGFGARYCGWGPTVGKNRVMGRVFGEQNPRGEVTGAGEISHGGGGPPRALREPPAWAAEDWELPRSGVEVGVVDTDMVTHDYLTGAWIGPYLRADERKDPVYAEEGHATFIAGLIRRYAPTATLQVRPGLDENGQTDAWSIAHKIVEAGRAGIDVLNLSFVCYTRDGRPPMVLSTALQRLDPEIVVVAAAGNHGYLTNGEQRKAAWPAALPEVVAVGASRAGRPEQRTDFTPDGPAWIDVLAPGENLESTFLHGTVQVWHDPDDDGPADPRRQPVDFTGYATWSGTSFAAGVVSALIADRTRPGRTTARQAYEELCARARRQQSRQDLPEDPVVLRPPPDRPRET
jgi:hypothetical protein